VIEKFYKQLGKKVRRVRESHGLSQAMVGKALKPPMTRASIANIESGLQRCMLHTLVQLADVLAVDVEELLP
jgi:DNA-binding XRE family transcriptional regulator